MMRYSLLSSTCVICSICFCCGRYTMYYASHLLVIIEVPEIEINKI